jgi:hypothetical protein
MQDVAVPLITKLNYMSYGIVYMSTTCILAMLNAIRLYRLEIVHMSEEGDRPMHSCQ